MEENTNLKVVNNHLNYDKVSLVKPSTSSYIHIAAEIDKKNIPFFLTSSSKKKDSLHNVKNGATY
ncbi:MAG: hypothetical protein V7691_10845 [Galbibacter orientalis]|uniref:hypothetical protein n=1 Tax=Galbibacter orientalis TaxID=453852 RepID=UPI0030027389